MRTSAVIVTVSQPPYPQTTTPEYCEREPGCGRLSGPPGFTWAHGIRASRFYLGPRYSGLQGVPGPTVPRPPGFTWAYTTTTATQPHQRDKTNSNVTRGVTSWSVEHAPTSPCRWSTLWSVEHAPTFSRRWNTHRPSRGGGTRADPPAATVGGAPHDDGVTQNRTFGTSHSRENSKLDCPSRGNNP